MMSDFKVGDKVTFINNKSKLRLIGISEKEAGKTGVIRKIKSNFYIKMDESNHEWNCDEEHLLPNKILNWKQEMKK